MNRIKVFVLASLVAIVAFTGCQNPINPGLGGILTVSMNDAVSRNILPGISMNPASYDLVGAGPNGASFSKSVGSGSSSTMTGLVFGDWTVIATAKNASGTAIGQGSGTVTVLSNASVNLSITVRPYEGFGTLALHVNWPATQVQTAQILSNLTPSSGSARNLAFTVNGSAGTASFSASDVATGYHTLILKLLDNGHLTIGAVEVVRIVKDQTTSGTLAFTNVNQATGSLQVNLTPEMADPLQVSISGSAETKPANQSLALSAGVSNYDDNVTFVWYVNGDAVATGAAFTLDNSWGQGYYRVDVTAFSIDGKRAGSATANVQVVKALITGMYNFSTVRGVSDPTFGKKYWQALATSSDGRKIVACNDSNGGSGFITTSADGGETWTQRISAGKRYWNCVAISDNGNTIVAADNDSIGSISISHDAGEAWIDCSAIGKKRWSAIAMSRDGSKIVICSTDGVIVYSSDGGFSWITLLTSSDQSWVTIDISEDGSFILVGAYGGYLYSSTNGGTEWIRHDLLGVKNWTSVSLSIDGLMQYAVGSDTSLFFSSNGGVSWTERAGSAPRYWTKIESLDHNHLVAFVDGYLMKSSDHGVSWINTAYSPMDKIVFALNGSVIYGTDWPGFLKKSSDGGISWSDFPTYGSTIWYGTAVSANGRKMAAVNDYGYVQISENGGLSWRVSESAGNRRWQSLGMSADGSTLIAGGDGVYISVDGGFTFTVRPGLRGYRVGISGDGTKLFATDVYQKVYRSKDSGVTWQEVSALEGNRLFNSVSVSYDGTHVTFVDSKGYVYCSSDGGDTWSVKTSLGQRQWTDSEISLDGSRIVVVGGGSVFVSTDAGTTWISRTVGSVSTLAMSANGMRIIAGGYTGDMFFLSEDGGVTWAEYVDKGRNDWRTMAMSADGSVVLMGGFETLLYRGN